MSPYMPDRRALFDIAAAGPLGGMVLAVPISFVGLSLPEGSFPIRHLEGFVLGFPVLFQIFHHLKVPIPFDGIIYLCIEHFP